MTLVEEMITAGRGVVALVIGRRDASQYFDLTTRGLVGSFIALIVATTVNTYLPFVQGAETEGGSAWQVLLFAVNIYVLQIGFAAIVLNQFKRLDGLMPYLVADNWATFFITLLTIVLTFAGVGSDVTILMLGVLVLVVEINIARLIVTLTPMQIAAFLIAQLVAGFVGLIILGAIFPMPAGI